MIKRIIFDLDRTLIPWLDEWDAMVEKTYNYFNIPFEEDEFSRFHQVMLDYEKHHKKFDKKDIEENKAMACLAYIVAPVPYFTEEKSKWVRYHAIQGMNFFIIFVSMCLAVSIINSLILFPFPFLKGITRTILYSFGVIYALIGIINVCNGEAKELPIINKFKFIKK